MNFEACTIVIPVIRETDLFEQVVGTILDTCNHNDLKEFIIVVHPKYTAQESFKSIEKMKQRCEKSGISYTVLAQKLPGMGGAIRDAMDIAKGSHSIMICADYCYDPAQINEFIMLSKQFPKDIIMGSRYIGDKWKRNKKYPFYKFLWNKASQFGLKILYQAKISDFTAAYWMYPTKYFQSINWIETGHPFSLEQTLKYIRLGVTFHEISFTLIGGSESKFLETLSYLRPAISCLFIKREKIIKPGMGMFFDLEE